MNYLARVSLPGYDALTDTNPDHFALYTDGTTDHILIKEKTRGVLTKPTGGSPTYINHNLGYIPFVLAWATIGNNRIFLSGGNLTGTYDITYFVNSQDIGFTNYTGSTAIINYFIFYDKQAIGSNPIAPLPDQMIGITKIGYDATTETNPNNYIFRSDLNTLKILYTDTATFSIAGETTTTVSSPQKVWFNKNPAVIAFARKQNSNYVLGPSQFTNGSWDPVADNYKFFSCWADNNNIFYNVRNDNAGSITVTFRYYLFEI